MVLRALYGSQKLSRRFAKPSPIGCKHGLREPLVASPFKALFKAIVVKLLKVLIHVLLSHQKLPITLGLLRGVGWDLEAPGA
jgi:hypothetical protein